jgi:hypothetical protein
VLSKGKALLAALAVSALAGCATNPQQAIDLAPQTLESAKVGVAMTALPAIEVYTPGADCLLCLAAASMANSSLKSHVKTLPYEDLPKLKSEVAELLRKKGATVVVIDENVKLDALPASKTEGQHLAKKDFTPLAQKYGVDKLVVIEIASIGFERTYAGYLPTSDPKGILRGAGYMVNLRTNAYEWYQPVNVMKSADKKWDESPKYPGLTNAYFQALETGKDSFLKPFGN